MITLTRKQAETIQRMLTDARDVSEDWEGDGRKFHIIARRTVRMLERKTGKTMIYRMADNF